MIGAKGWSLCIPMRLILLLVTVSCAQMTPDTEQITTPLWSSGSVTLKATRSYSPTHWEDGVATLSAPLSFVIPNQIPVILGNSGNHWAELRFRESEGHEVICDYRGGSDKAHPETAAERARAHRYLFKRCSNGLKAGQIAQSDWFQLHLHNGDHKDPAQITQIQVQLGGTVAELEPPVPPEESVAIRDSFSWTNTVALPEQNVEGHPSLYYALVYVEEREQVEALDEMLVHYSPLPLFSEEFERWQGQQGTFGHQGDGKGLFLFTLMPAVTYNLLRKTALEGEPIYSVIALRDIPEGARLSDGSASYAALRESGFLYRGLQPNDVEGWGTSNGVSKQPLLNKLRRAIVRTIAKVVVGVVRLVVKGIGAIDRFFSGSIQLGVGFNLLNTDPAFGNGPMQRAWGERAGQQVVLPDVRLSVWQWRKHALLPTLFSAKTGDSGSATVKVTKDRRTAFCIRLESDAAVVTNFVLGIEFCDFQSLSADRTQQDINVTLPVRHGHVNVLAQASEGRAYLRDVANYTPHRAIILVGRLASLAQERNAVAPCLNFSGLGAAPYVIAVTAALTCRPPSSGWNALIAQAAIAAVALAGPAYAVDVILPNDEDGGNLNSRGVMSHEYGHFTLCSMLHASGENNIKNAYTEAALQRLRNCGNPTATDEAAYINEAFADFMAGQFVGGANNFRPPNSERFLGVSYCNATSDNCLDSNCGEGVTNECGVDSAFDVQIARVATLLHDAFDGRPSLPPQNVPGNGDVWSRNLATEPLRYSNNRNGNGGDEQVALPGTAIFRMIQHWDARGDTLRQSSFLGGLSDAMAEVGVNWCGRCSVFALHDATWTTTSQPEPICQTAPIRNWIGQGTCSATWTPWLNRDRPFDTGDWETLSDFVNAGQVCPNPLGIQCQTVNGVDWTQAGQVYTCNAAAGGICRNDDQPNGTCLDYQVRFLCP